MREKFPNVGLSLDSAEIKSGASFLDIDNNGHFVVAQHQPDVGYGVSSYLEGESVLFTHKPDEIYKTEEETVKRIVEMIESRISTN